MSIDRELINSRIEKIKDPVQKVMLQDILLDIFTELIDYNDECFHLLEEKIKKEEKNKVHPYFVQTAVCKKEEFDEMNRFWFNMTEEKVNRQDYRLDTIFLDCDFDVISRCLNQTFTANITIDNTVETIKVRFAYAKVYLDKIEWLYHQFIRNKMKWQTINCPFLYKFLDIIDVDKKIPISVPIEKIELNMGELGVFIHTDLVLVWNIEEMFFETEAVKTAGEKVIQYEHKVPIQDLEEGYLFIFEEQEQFFSIKSENSILVRTENCFYEEIRCLHFNSYDEAKDNMNLFYLPYSNKRREIFFNELVENESGTIDTLGEIKRILNQYPVLEEEGLRLERVELKPINNNDCMKIQLDCNSFIQSHQLWNKEMEAVFYFANRKNQGTIMTKEVIAFLLSELQLHFIEYRCIAVLSI